MALEPSTAELTVSDARSPIRSWLMDMDGVLVHEEDLIPGADRFVAILREREMPFLVLTNNSLYTRRDLVGPAAQERHRGPRAGDLHLGPGHGAVPGRPAPRRLGLRHRRGRPDHGPAPSGYTLTERDPDYVVVGETRTYSFSRITQAVRRRARRALHRHQPRPQRPEPEGPLPATGSLASLISTRDRGRARTSSASRTR